MKKIIATGKGGVGKTTLVATLARLLVNDGYRVLVIDTDPSMNLAMSLGVPYSMLTTLADNKAAIRDRLGVSGNEDDRQGHAHEVDDDSLEDVISTYTVLTGDKIRVMVMGTIPYGGAGCICSSIALVKLIIERLEKRMPSLDFIIVDSQAGPEVLGRGLAADYDYNLVVTEATPKSLEVARHVMKLARDIGVKKQLVIVNKVEDGADIKATLKEMSQDFKDIYPVCYDRMVVEADKQSRLIVDFYPDSPAICDIRLIKEAIEG
ncbi:AAA family ATPase [Methanocella conradii]|uniref:ATP-binding protein n=1 Tax=Methanocella conradii TaxID=1175444 RepID=UPI0024B32C8E|nr:AAA family ATPase [Methanocella conradii]MDI6896277.1 AAA family ATPase [Methanocella conradii]